MNPDHRPELCLDGSRHGARSSFRGRARDGNRRLIVIRLWTVGGALVLGWRGWDALWGRPNRPTPSRTATARSGVIGAEAWAGGQVPWIFELVDQEMYQGLRTRFATPEKGVNRWVGLLV